MTDELKDKILSIKPEYSDNNNTEERLPNQISLYYYEDDYSIDLVLDSNDVITEDIMIGEEWYQTTDKDIRFIYKYLRGLLDYEIELTKDYYYKERFERQDYYYNL